MFHIDPLARLEVEVKVFGVTADHETQKSRELWLSGTAQGQGHGYLPTYLGRYQTKVNTYELSLLPSTDTRLQVVQVSLPYCPVLKEDLRPVQ